MLEVWEKWTLAVTSCEIEMELECELGSTWVGQKLKQLG